MKKHPASRLLQALLACAFVLSGCNKVERNLPPGDIQTLCRIKRISFLVEADQNQRDTITFSYNAFGLPDTGFRRFVATGSPQFLFRYDDQHRLQDYIGAYNGFTSGEFWTRYFYSDDGRTVYDTTYIFPGNLDTWPPENFLQGSPRVNISRYDQEGRIVQYIYIYNPPIHLPDTVIYSGTETFTYDREGDLEGYTYDNRTSFQRTNPVWEFINNEYSAHNPFPVEAYNVFGLPTKFNMGAGANEGSFFLYQLSLYSQFSIDYDCDGSERSGGH